MASWQDDPEVYEKLDAWLVSQQKPLNEFMECIMQHAGEEPHWGLLVVYGKFVMTYNLLKSESSMTETEIFQETTARIANDSLTQTLIAAMMGGMVNKGVGL
jgi:hypothetical protein